MNFHKFARIKHFFFFANLYLVSLVCGLQVVNWKGHRKSFFLSFILCIRNKDCLWMWQILFKTFISRNLMVLLYVQYRFFHCNYFSFPSTVPFKCFWSHCTVLGKNNGSTWKALVNGFKTSPSDTAWLTWVWGSEVTQRQLPQRPHPLCGFSLCFKMPVTVPAVLYLNLEGNWKHFLHIVLL